MLSMQVWELSLFFQWLKNLKPLSLIRYVIGEPSACLQAKRFQTKCIISAR
jgi:hypothetical protein